MGVFFTGLYHVNSFLASHSLSSALQKLASDGPASLHATKSGLDSVAISVIRSGVEAAVVFTSDQQWCSQSYISSKVNVFCSVGSILVSSIVDDIDSIWDLSASRGVALAFILNPV